MCAAANSALCSGGKRCQIRLPQPDSGGRQPLRCPRSRCASWGEGTITTGRGCAHGILWFNRYVPTTHGVHGGEFVLTLLEAAADLLVGLPPPQIRNESPGSVLAPTLAVPCTRWPRPAVGLLLDRIVRLARNGRISELLGVEPRCVPGHPVVVATYSAPSRAFDARIAHRRASEGAGQQARRSNRARECVPIGGSSKVSGQGVGESQVAFPVAPQRPFRALFKNGPSAGCADLWSKCRRSFHYARHSEVPFALVALIQLLEAPERSARPCR